MVKTRASMILSAGCGRRAPEPELVRLDRSPEVQPDIAWDLDEFPYPLEDSSFAIIECIDVIEHLDDIPRVMGEFHRILEPDGTLRIATPHFSSANSFVDPTHRWHLSYFSFDYFCGAHEPSYYSTARYRMKSRRIQFGGGRLMRSIVSRLANRSPKSYEERFAWMFPAWFLYFELEAIKQQK
jgi:SAM-dependent methyltransferase